MKSTYTQRLDDILKEFSALEDMQMRYALLIELSSLAPSPESDFAVEENRFHGCQSRLWYMLEGTKECIELRITSDTLILRGFFYLVMELLSGLSREELKNVQLDELPQALGLAGVFSSQRTSRMKKLTEELRAKAAELPRTPS